MQPRRPGGGPRRALDGADRLPQGRGAGRPRGVGADDGRAASSTGWRPPSAGTPWRSSCGTTATHWTRPATTPWPCWRWRPASTPWPPTTSTTPRPAGFRLATTLAAVRARRPLGRAGGLAARRPHRLPALRGRAGPPLRPLARGGGAGGRAGGGVRLRPAPGGARASPTSRSPPATTSSATCAELTEQGALRRYGPRGAERVPGAWAQIDHELSVIGDLGYAGYFLVVWDIAEVCRRLGIYCQGRGLGRQLGRLLRPGGHQRRRRLAGPALRAVPLPGPRRPARHRRGHRVGPARGGHPVRLRALRPAPRRPGGQRHHLPAPLGHPRRRARPWATRWPRWTAGPRGSSTATGAPRGWPWPRRPRRQPPDLPATRPRTRRAGCRRWWPSWRSRCSTGPATSGSTRPAWSSATGRWWRCARSSGAACPAAPCCSGTRTTARPSGWSSSTCWAWACWRPCTAPSTWSAEHHRVAVDLAQPPPGARGLRPAVPGRHGGGLPGGEPGPDGHAAPGPAAAASTTWWWRWRSSGPGPSRGTPSTPTSAGAGALEPVTYLHPLLEPILRAHPGGPAVPRAADGDGGGHRRVQRGRGRRAAPGHGGQAVGGPHGPAARTGSTPGWPSKGVTGEAADAVYRALAAFANFGFPESHSVSFAHLVYSSSWLKLHYPAAFCAGLLNSQPMGFWSPQSLVADARRHGVEVRRPHVDRSVVGASLEGPGRPRRPGRPCGWGWPRCGGWGRRRPSGSWPAAPGRGRRTWCGGPG